MSLSKQLGSQHTDLFTAFWEHPFLRGLHDGSVPAACVRHYVGQDHQYLNAFIRCYGTGIAMSPDRDWMGWFSGQVQFLLEDEQHPHHVMCDAIGVSYDSIRQQPLAPSAQAYVDHMQQCSHDSLGVLLAAMLPCPWTYVWAGTKAMTEQPPAPDNPFRGWWEFYGSPECQGILAEFRSRLDRLADEAGPSELDRMARAFELSCHHEIRFWQMAWTLEDWTPPQPG